MAMKIYQAPNGMTYRYEEGTQPDGYAEVTPKAKAKARPSRNKARTPANKERG